MVTLTFFFLGVNQSGPKTSSTTNHKFYKALRRLQGPWSKQPLNEHANLHFDNEYDTHRSS